MKDLISFKHELQNIISGDDTKGESNSLKAVQTHLKQNHFAGAKAEIKQFARSEEERALII